jgi:hypothetical protein
VGSQNKKREQSWNVWADKTLQTEQNYSTKSVTAE